MFTEYISNPDPYKSGRFRRHKRRYKDPLSWIEELYCRRRLTNLMFGNKHKRRAMKRLGESTETPKGGNGPLPGQEKGTTIQFNRWKGGGPDSDSRPD